MSETNAYGDMEDVFQEFISESREMLDEVELRLIELESQRGACGRADAEIIASIFRVFHSVKGSAGFLQLDVIVRVTRQAETLLHLIRRGKIQLIPDHTGLLCRCCDLIRLMLDAIEEGRSDAEHAAAGGTMEAELRRAIDVAVEQRPITPQAPREAVVDRPAPKQVSTGRRTEDHAHISSLIARLKDLARQVDKANLGALAKMHGCCEAIAKAAAPGGPDAAPPIFERASSSAHLLVKLILEGVEDAEAALASVIAMVSELPSTRVDEDQGGARE